MAFNRNQILQPLSPYALKAMLADGKELAIIDVREELIFSQGHLLFARSVPLSRLIRAGADLVVLDSRPFDEYRRVSIPTAINVPGAELVLRIRDLVSSPDTMVVVNCAGRTRSIIGAQSLINAGVPNRVVALRNGTMGWSLADRSCESGKARRAPQPSPAALGWAKAAADAVARRFGIERIDAGAVEKFRMDGERTLYVFDVRDPT